MMGSSETAEARLALDCSRWLHGGCAAFANWRWLTKYFG